MSHLLDPLHGTGHGGRRSSWLVGGAIALLVAGAALGGLALRSGGRCHCRAAAVEPEWQPVKRGCPRSGEAAHAPCPAQAAADAKPAR